MMSTFWIGEFCKTLPGKFNRSAHSASALGGGRGGGGGRRGAVAGLLWCRRAWQGRGLPRARGEGTEEVAPRSRRWVGVGAHELDFELFHGCECVYVLVFEMFLHSFATQMLSL